MKRLLATLLFIASTICSTSCGTIYWDATPVEVSTMTIPAEGGIFEFKVVDYTPYEETRFEPGEWYKEYRYRIVEDGIVSKESTMFDLSISYELVVIEFTPNDTNHTKVYTIDIQIADDFYSVGEDQHFGEWQTVWILTQQSLQRE